MKIFKSFQELIDYVPNCLICGKQLELHLNGRVTTSKLHFRLKIKDNQIIGKNKNYLININPADNQIILGQEIVNELLHSYVTVIKKCYTCRCIITTTYNGAALETYAKSYKTFPHLTLYREEMYFTRANNKRVNISQIYYNSGLSNINQITVDNKPIKPIYINFNQFKNLDHLNQRLSTMLTFS